MTKKTAAKVFRLLPPEEREQKRLAEVARRQIGGRKSRRLPTASAGIAPDQWSRIVAIAGLTESKKRP